MIRRGTLLDVANVARVHIASYRATYTGLFPDAHVNSRTEDRRREVITEALARPDYELYVAEDESDGIVGFADWGKSRERVLADAELYAIYLLPSHQRRGLGRQLIGAVARAAIAHGHRSLCLRALEGNPTCAFYRSVGGAVVGEEPIEVGGESFRHLIFRWADRELERLAGAT